MVGQKVDMANFTKIYPKAEHREIHRQTWGGHNSENASRSIIIISDGSF